MAFSSVDFPDPFGPMIAVTVPEGISKVDEASATVDPYRSSTAEATIAASLTLRTRRRSPRSRVRGSSG